MSQDDQEEIRAQLSKDVKRNPLFQKVIWGEGPMARLENKFSSEELESNVRFLLEEVRNLERKFKANQEEINVIRSIVLKKSSLNFGTGQETDLALEWRRLRLDCSQKLSDRRSNKTEPDVFFNFVLSEIKSGKTEKEVINEANRLFSDKTQYDVVKKINEVKSQLFDKQEISEELRKLMEKWENIE